MTLYQYKVIIKDQRYLMVSSSLTDLRKHWTSDRNAGFTVHPIIKRNTDVIMISEYGF